MSYRQSRKGNSMKLRLSASKRQKKSYNISAALAARGIVRSTQERNSHEGGDSSIEPQEGGTVRSTQESTLSVQNSHEEGGFPIEPQEGGTVRSTQESTHSIQNSHEEGGFPIEPQEGEILRNKRRRIYPSQKRRRKVVNAGLMKWKLEKLSAKDNTLLGVPTDNSCTGTKADDCSSAATTRNQLHNLTSQQHDIYEFEEETDIKQYHKGDPAMKYILEEMEVESHELVTQPGPPDASRDPIIDSISGRYVVDGKHFYTEMRKLENHRFSCTGGGYYKLMSTEVKCFVWTLKFECPSCNSREVILSDPTPTTSPGNQELSICDSAVWGTMAVGGGHRSLEELFSTMGIKAPDKKTFSKKENEIGNKWQDVLLQSMLQAGREEKQLAIERCDVDEHDTPFISVIVDGGWSHRSHGHRYTSNSGVVCVIGLYTKKLLHIDVRNKYCSMCLYLMKNQKIPEHEGCFRNWEGTSQGMESDMLVQAFRSSKQLHGLEYRVVIGDGDSSVFAKLREKVSYGLQIQKSECANHAVKNYCKSLFAQKQLPQGVRKILSPSTVLRLKKDARYAIYHIAETSKNAQDLREDLINGPAHVLGIHTNCKEYFCKKKENERELVGFVLAAYNFAQDCLKPLLRKAHRLTSNDTSNLAENYMSLVAKFSGGKQVNRCKRGSYQHRCNGAALDYQFGTSWTHDTMKTIVGKSPSSLIKKTAAKRSKAKLHSKRSLINSRKQRIAERYLTADDAGGQPEPHRTMPKTNANPRDGGKDYGPLCQDLDMEKDDYLAAAKLFKERLNVSTSSRLELEEMTRGQHTNELWFMERRSRLTASHFGEICKRRQTTPSARLVETLLYPKTYGKTTDPIQYGMTHERDAKQAYLEQHPGTVLSECGLFIHRKFGFLGASPDALINDDGILEVKCPYSARDVTFEEAVDKCKTFCLDCNGNLPQRHNYYFQVQGQLEIVDRVFCDFVVWGPKFLKIIRIHRDQDFWRTQMEPKLTNFYDKFLLPELVDPRKCRSMPLRDSRIEKAPSLPT